MFSGKEEEWLRWKEETEDYVDAMRPGLKQARRLAAQTKSEVVDRLQVDLTEEAWKSRPISSCYSIERHREKPEAW